MLEFVRAPVFGRVLLTQWLWARIGLVPLTLAAFTIPVLSVQWFSDLSATGFRVRFLVEQHGVWAPAYPVLAAAIGLLLGITAWSADHRAGHVYALSLPVSRFRFTGLRLAAGVALLALPVVFLWAGALVSSWLAAVPPTLQTYPTALAARFFLASFLAFAVFFAISSATPKTAGALLMIVVMLGLAQLFVRLFGIGIDLIGPSVDMITTWPGPLDVFGGRWMLIDF